MSAPRSLRETQAAFLDRVMRTGGADPGRATLDVPDARLGVYRDMVLGGYRMMLSFVHTESLRLLDHVLAEAPAADGAADRDALIARMIATTPASTHSTREIADRWAWFFPEAYPDLVARRPEVVDIARIERAELHANYHPDDPGHGATEDDAERIRALDVDSFLATRVLRAPSATVLHLAYPAASVQDELRERRFPPSPAPAPQTVAVSRSPRTLLPVVRVHDEHGAGLLEASEPGAPVTLEALAERWISRLPEGARDVGEEALFRVFGETVLRALGDGFLRLAD